MASRRTRRPRKITIVLIDVDSRTSSGVGGSVKVECSAGVEWRIEICLRAFNHKISSQREACREYE